MCLRRGHVTMVTGAAGTPAPEELLFRFGFSAEEDVATYSNVTERSTDCLDRVVVCCHGDILR